MSKKKGRPTKFNQQLSDKIIELAVKGKTDQQIADIVGIDSSTISLWRHKKPEFSQSLKEAKQAADELVEASLFRRAVGYSHSATKIFQFQGEILEHNYIEKYPPDTVAAIFWLKNRKPDEWKEKTTVEFEDVEDMDFEE